jgi:aspartyl/asparaginyl-tRNA synthetase
VAHLRPRTNLIGAVARVRHTLAQALHRFFDEQGFFWVSTPLITASDTEGAGEMFRVWIWKTCRVTIRAKSISTKTSSVKSRS